MDAILLWRGAEENEKEEEEEEEEQLRRVTSQSQIGPMSGQGGA